MFDTGVFERYGTGSIPRRVFYLLIGGILSTGFLVTAYVASLTGDWNPNLWVFFGVGLVIPIFGILLSQKSGNWLVSLIGFFMVVVPFGAILGPVLAEYTRTMPGVVSEAALLTGLVTATMAGSGLLFPNFYSKIGGALLVALFCVVGVSVAALFIPELHGMTWIHYLAAGVFALYIGFDMWRASQIPPTADNAVDVSVSLYLDIINLFLRIMIILGQSRR